MMMVRGPRSGKLAAWQAPDVDDLWYPIEAMRWANVPVFVSLNARDATGGVRPRRGGFEVVAVIQRRQKRLWWYQVGSWSYEEKRWLRHDLLELEIVGRDPPTRRSPAAFRPIDPAAWRRPLPEPLPPSQGWIRPPAVTPEPHEAIDPHLASDGWPHPGLPLGIGVPASREECEARVLRAFRTSNSRAGGGLGHVSRETCADIPREIVLMSCAINAAWWSVHPDADGGALEAVRSAWEPTKRDLGDWVGALGWLNCLDAKAVRVLAMRASDPPWSFRQIAERLRMKSHNTARALYERALDHAFASARWNGGRG